MTTYKDSFNLNVVQTDALFFYFVQVKGCYLHLFLMPVENPDFLSGLA